MKKILSLLLALAMLLSMCLFVGAEEEEEIIPFTMVNWGGLDAKWGIDNVIAMPMFWTSQKVKPEKWTVQYGGSTDISDISELLKRSFNKLPQGARHINFMGVGAAIRLYAEEIVFLDKAEKQIYDWMTEFLEEYHSIGGKLDGIILDIEYLEMFYYYFNVKGVKADSMLMHRIVQDPRYQETIRPLLVERGFRFWENPNEYAPEIYTISTNLGDKYANEQKIWDAVMQEVQNGVIRRAILEPLLKYYPDALVSDYKVKDDHVWYTGGENVGSNTTKAGNSSNENMYYNKPGEDFFRSYTTMAGYNDTLYECTAFNQALASAVNARNLYLSTDNHKFNVWFAGFDYTGTVDPATGITGAGAPNPYKPAANTYYYSEMLYHIGLLDPQPFVGWITSESYPPNADMEYVYRVVSQNLQKLTDLVGAADRKPIVLPGNIYNRKFILSGMYAGGRNVWRITPDDTVVSLEDFKIEGDDPTFYVKGQTVTFPGGKIIEEATVNEIGTYGYWIETDEDVYPIITNDEDRLEEFPAFKADFEQFEVGVFDYLTSKPSGVWDMAWSSGQPAQIVAVDGGKALEFTGDYSVNIVTMPENVTAGDTYAEYQSWEATVTIPEGMTEDQELYILTYDDKRYFVDDTGFKVAGGKLYYDQEGESIELCDLSAGTYRFQRQMDLSDLDAPVSDYFVYDMQGNEVAKALDIPNLEIGAKVYAVGFESVDVEGKVLLDDFVLRVLGVNTDLFLYDAKFGTQVEDITQSQSTNTAYRMSWMNASDAVATAEVIASVYEGDTLISETVVQTVTMNPGCDDVLTGIVEVEEGKSVVISLKTTEGQAPADKPNDPSTGTDTKTPGNKYLLPLIMVGVAVIACVVVLIVTAPSGKNKKKKSAKK